MGIPLIYYYIYISYLIQHFTYISYIYRKILVSNRKQTLVYLNQVVVIVSYERSYLHFAGNTRRYLCYRPESGWFSCGLRHRLLWLNASYSYVPTYSCDETQNIKFSLIFEIITIKLDCYKLQFMYKYKILLSVFEIIIFIDNFFKCIFVC